MARPTDETTDRRLIHVAGELARYLKRSELLLQKRLDGAAASHFDPPRPVALQRKQDVKEGAAAMLHLEPCRDVVDRDRAAESQTKAAHCFVDVLERVEHAGAEHVVSPP